MIFRTTPLPLLMNITSLLCALGTWMVAALVKLISEESVNKYMNLQTLERDRQTSKGESKTLSLTEENASNLREHLISKM